MAEARGTAFSTDECADGLVGFLDSSPSPFHAVATAGRMLAQAGFTELDPTEPWPRRGGRFWTVRGGSLVAWSTGHVRSPAAGMRVVGAHTDSPNLRVKPRPDLARAGWQQLGVEVYGGPLLDSWFDRDLGLSGRVALAGDGIRTELVRVDEPVLRVSRLAIHLDRAVRDEGMKVNPQQHLAPHWGPGDSPGDLRAYLAERLGTRAQDVLAWDLMTHDLAGARRIGHDRELIASARLDNLATCYAGVRALVAAADDPGALAGPQVLVLFDHEEVGSLSERGAFGAFLPVVLERLVAQLGGGREDLHRALAATVVASGDMAHATHPNYADRHEPQHQVRMNGGPVLKVNSSLRYATDAPGAAVFRAACAQARVPCQEFVVRSDLPCGSTVGPMTAALTGATTVDFGAPTLSMHSVREVAGSADQAMYAACLAAFLAPGPQACLRP